MNNDYSFNLIDAKDTDSYDIKKRCVASKNPFFLHFAQGTMVLRFDSSPVKPCRFTFDSISKVFTWIRIYRDKKVIYILFFLWWNKWYTIFQLLLALTLQLFSTTGLLLSLKSQSQSMNKLLMRSGCVGVL